MVTIAFNGEAGIGSLHNKVDAVGVGIELRNDAVAAVHNGVVHALFKERIERPHAVIVGYAFGFLITHGVSCHAVGVFQQFVAHVLGISQLVHAHGME